MSKINHLPKQIKRLVHNALSRKIKKKKNYGAEKLSQLE
jgi:hypothetical protein